MPSLGGITAWISVGEQKLDEIGVDIRDDLATCYVQVPGIPQVPPAPEPTSPSTNPPTSAHPITPPLPASTNLEYAVNWKISDLTYSLAVKVVIDGKLEIEKVHLGRGAIVQAKNTGSIDALPVTDDWSKRRLLTFVKLQAAEDAQLPSEEVGSIKLSFYRAGRASLSGGIKTAATGFHRTGVVDPGSLIKHTTVDDIYTHSHATGLGSITFGPPKKVPSVGARDPHPYVSFLFQYRSRELISEIAPDDWLLTAPPPVNFEKELPTIRNEGNESHIHLGGSGASHMSKKPSIAVRAKKWAADVKHTAQAVRMARSAPDRVKTRTCQHRTNQRPFYPSQPRSWRPCP
ncbi:hypothetical protein BS47DRAFT_126996 [Hydnum rufescens UP504]|uniref:Uncharacterized protein n=1 Tax=Hydnum rufescens UP504 TaxID=1448309 RepID=A0A9P6DTP4_9AGAM|nr:hypothetical protein BS47DRAFT_126996 [Hydnum rufescens UP504]